MKTTLKIMGCIFAAAWFGAAAWSAPSYINYQGQLNGADGQPLPTGNYTMEFNIYDQAQLGARVWGPFIFDGAVATGHGPLVPVVNGRFNVIIGPQDTAGAPISAAFASSNRFMQIAVAGGAPILPRQQFLSTAYAFESVNAQQAQLAQQSVVASNLVQAVADALSPPGTIAAFGGTNIPSGWLLCDGAAMASTNYARLFAAIGAAWGDGTYDRGVLENPVDPGSDFNVPDLRGTFLRGVNGSLTDTNWWDPNSASRMSRHGSNAGNQVGSVQADDFASHNHNPNGSYIYLVRISGANTIISADNSPTELDLKSGGVIAAAGGSETRPKNAYVNYIIKY